MEGWPEELADAKTVEDLPASARKYVERIQDLGGVKVGVVSIGPSREQSLPL
jgi:adenylosuccinate synthase